MNSFLTGVCFFIWAFSMGLLVGYSYHIDTLKNVGIKEIRKCEIDTTNCQSNWYEIVWIKERGN